MSKSKYLLKNKCFTKKNFWEEIMADYKKGAEFIYDFTKNIIDKCGPRLPGSDEEKLAADEMQKVFTDTLGVETKKERFLVAPRASIGAIPLLGVCGLISLGVYFISPLASSVLCALILIFATAQIFTYSGLFDVLFHHQLSHNVYSVMEARNNKPDYTLVFSGHIDSSWCWKHSATNPNTAILKTASGIVSILALLVLGIVNYIYRAEFGIGVASGYDITNPIECVFTFVPLLFIFPMIFLSNYLSWDKKKASPGAMDNLSGVALGLYMAKRIKEEPELVPDNCRVIVAGLGSEEAGLKGASEFAKQHHKDGLLVNPYIINLDSFRDYDNFNAVKGDIWLFSHFDKDLIKMTVESIEEAGLKSHIISNPVGGCDSTPFYRKGYKTITLNAQNPVLTNYYHTIRDTYDSLDMNTLEKSCEVLENLVQKVNAYHKEKGGYINK